MHQRTRRMAWLDSWKTLASALTLRWHRSVGPSLLAAWRRHLQDTLPRAWRAALADRVEERWIVPADDRLDARHATTRTIVSSVAEASDPDVLRGWARDARGGIAPEDLRWILVLPETCGLRRRLLWPAAALRDLRTAIPLQLEQLTAFRESKVAWDVALHGTPVPGKVALDLAVVPRTVIDGWIARLGDAGIALSAIDYAASPQGRAGFNLLPPEQRARTVRPEARTTRRLVLAAGILLLALGLQTRAMLDSTIARREARLASLERQADAVQRATQTVLAQQAARHALQQAVAAHPPVSTLLDDLSRRLPKSTWVERLSLRPSGRLELQGQSPDAPALVAILKASPLLRDPALQGAVQPDPTTGKERFLITARERGPLDGHPDARATVR